MVVLRFVLVIWVACFAPAFAQETAEEGAEIVSETEAAEEIPLPGFTPEIAPEGQTPYVLPERDLGSTALMTIQTRRAASVNVLRDRTSCIGTGQPLRTELCMARVCAELRAVNTRTPACCLSEKWHCEN